MFTTKATEKIAKGAEYNAIKPLQDLMNSNDTADIYDGLVQRYVDNKMSIYEEFMMHQLAQIAEYISKFKCPVKLNVR